MQPCLPAGAKTVFFRPWSGKEGARSASHCLFLFGPFGVGCPRSDKLLVLYCYEMEPNIPYYHTGAWYISAATECMSAIRPRHMMYTYLVLLVCLLRIWHEFGFPNRESVVILRRMESVTSPAYYSPKINLPPLRCRMPRPCLSSLLFLAVRNIGIYIRLRTLFACALSGIRIPLHTRSHQALLPTWYLLLVSVTTSSGGSRGHPVVTTVVVAVAVVVVVVAVVAVV